MIIVPTIDVEGVHGQRPFEQLVCGQLEHSLEEWGVFRQAAIFQRFGVSATFFVDCYEHTLWGEARWEDVCCRLRDLGQDVQLHTHPSWRDDIHDSPSLRLLKKEKTYFPQHLDLMAKLSLAQQIEVLEHGCDLFQKWLGVRPVAHRSGGYSINADTVRALRHVGIALDSSMHAAHRNSQLTWSTNRFVCRDGLLELPVTLLANTFALPGAPRSTLYRKLLKTDLDCCDHRDFLTYVERGSELGVSVMNLFMHSYSLLSFDPFFRTIWPSYDQAAKLERLLADLCRRSDVRFLSCARLVTEYGVCPESLDGSDAIPEARANLKISRLALNKLRNTLADQAVGQVERWLRRRAS